MKAPSRGGRVALRSMGKLLMDQYRPRPVFCQPQGHHRRLMTHSSCRVMEFLNGKWCQGLLMQRVLPTTTSWGRQLQQEHGFLSVGDGDEDSGLSKHFEEDRVFGYTPEQVYDVVAGVDLYEEFVPWCLKSKVLSRKDNGMEAELEIRYKLFVERYISHVELKPPSLIRSTVSESALFDFLNNEWHFKLGPSAQSCHLHFVVDFQFKSLLYRQVAHLFFNEVQACLVDSFDKRCKVVYGPSSDTTLRVAHLHPSRVKSSRMVSKCKLPLGLEGMEFSFTLNSCVG